MRIGIFGGTFDPIHMGHLQLAQSAAHEIPLDRVYLVPAKRSPFKSKLQAASPAHRWKMLKLALESHFKFSALDYELKRPAPSYTVNTLRFFKRQFPNDELYLLLGSDALADFKRWRGWKEIMSLATLVAGKRKNIKSKIPSEILRKTILLRSRMTAVSSSEIRVWSSSDVYLPKLVPAPVAQYILKNSLYQ